MSKFPVISAIVPLYNHGAYIGECLQSLLDIDYPGLEILVVDDGSTDDGPTIVERLAGNFPGRIRMLHHPGHRNRGVSASRNLAIGAALGELITFLDADDLALPGKIWTAAERLMSRDDIDGVLGRVCFQFEAGVGDAWDWSADDWRVDTDIEPESFLRATVLEGRCSLHTSGFLVRKSLFARAGLYAENRKLSEDYHLWLRMAACGRFLVVPVDQPFATYRRHSCNTWQPSELDSYRDMEVLLDVYRWAHGSDKVFQDVPGILKTAIYQKLGWCLGLARRNGHRGVGLGLYGRALRRFPGMIADRKLMANAVRLVQGR